MSLKIERLEEKFKIEISNILEREIRDKYINFVTINEVKITNDLSFAKVYVTVLEDSKKETTLKALNKASKFIEKNLCNKIEIRKMPEITFVYDESIEYGNKIEEIIDRINKNE